MVSEKLYTRGRMFMKTIKKIFKLKSNIIHAKGLQFSEVFLGVNALS